MISGNPYRRKRKFGIPWSREELKALEPFVKGRIKGKYRNCWHAARECQAAVEESPTGPEGRVPRRTVRAIHARILRRVRGLEWERGVDWSREELKVVDRCVRALVRSDARRHSVVEIMSSCESSLRRLHAAHPRAVWAQQERTRKATEAELRKRARELKQRWSGARWTPQENSIFETYAQALARGRTRSSLSAARSCLERLERLRNRDPRVVARRTLGNVTSRIRRLARRLGWAGYWTRQELRALEPYARGFARGKYRTAREAAAAFQAGLRLSRALKPDGPRAVAPRPVRGIEHALRRRAQALGLPRSRYFWTRDEARRLDWYADQVVSGRIRSARQAAREFLAERERLRQRRPDASRAGVRHPLSGAHGAIWTRARERGWRPGMENEE